MRSCGILLPVSSLPSPYGIGSLGKKAYEFIDFLADAGQKYWQVLPVGPTGYGDSPYQSFSAFASNPYFIDLDMLVQDGLISQDDIDEAQFKNDPGRIDYYDLYIKRFPLLKKACKRISREDSGFTAYIEGNSFWIENYALFMAIKEENNMTSFRKWPKALAKRDEAALDAAKERLKDEIHFWKAVQYVFHQQWMRMKEYANERNILIIGDMPIYVAEDSAELWAQPELFCVGEDGKLTEVAGCPPDAFSPTGQLWGNPLYNWEYHRQTGYHWWIKRLEHWGCFFNSVRIDHFRGFAGYYSIPAGNIDAVDGCWRKGPGHDFISVLNQKVSWLPIIAEDLGFLTKDVRELLKDSGYPGMKVLQFAFTSNESNEYLPYHYPRNCVVYTGTHDNTTTPDWAETAADEEKTFAMKYFGITEQAMLPEAMIRAAYESVADLAIIPIQDWLMLSAGARINTPSTEGNNWTWRLKEEQITTELTERIRAMAVLYGRSTAGHEAESDADATVQYVE